MLYNTQLAPLRMKVYGREVQQMVDYALTIEDRTERQAYAHSIMTAMKIVAQVPHPTQEENEKLWNHLAQLSDYQLDIDYPCSITPHEEEDCAPHLAYSQQHPRLRHYGVLVQNLLVKAANKDNPDHRVLGIKTAAGRMRENLYAVRGDMPSNERIAHDIELLTNGRISQEEALSLIS